MNSKTRQLLSLHEGRVPYVYKDSLGYLTAGVGFLVDKNKGGRIPEAVIDFWLDYLLDYHQHKLLEEYPWVDSLDEVRKAVLLDMSYNMGSLVGWPNFMKQVKLCMYKEAAATMRGSKWATQVKSRAVRLAKMMETGEWPDDIGQ